MLILEEVLFLFIELPKSAKHLNVSGSGNLGLVIWKIQIYVLNLQIFHWNLGDLL